MLICSFLIPSDQRMYVPTHFTSSLLDSLSEGSASPSAIVLLNALSRCDTPPELFATLTPLLERRIPWTRAALFDACDEQARPLATAGDASRALTCRVPLSIDGTRLGELGLASDWDALRVQWSLSDVLPHLALGLTRVLSHHDRAARERTEAIRGRAVRWSLTEREREVLELLSRGMQNKEIAGALGVSVKTVEKHVGNLLIKAGAQTRSQVVGMLIAR